MQWTEIAPALVGLGGIITALATWFRVRHGEGNKRLDTEVRSKELLLQADQQDNEQLMSLVVFQQGMLEKHQLRLDELQAVMELKAEEEAENRAELRLMRYQIAECEQDRVKLRARIKRLEEANIGSSDLPKLELDDP